MVVIISSTDVRKQFVDRLRLERLSQNKTQLTLAREAAVSLASLKRFEQTGQGSFELFCKLVYTLRLEGRLNEFLATSNYTQLEDVLIKPTRQRAGVKRK